MFLVLHPEWRAGVDLVRKMIPEANEQQAYEDGGISRLPVVMVSFGANCFAVLFEPVQQRAKFCWLTTENDKLCFEVYCALLSAGMDKVSGEEAERIREMTMK